MRRIIIKETVCQCGPLQQGSTKHSAVCGSAVFHCHKVQLCVILANSLTKPKAQSYQTVGTSSC